MFAPAELAEIVEILDPGEAWVEHDQLRDVGELTACCDGIFGDALTIHASLAVVGLEEAEEHVDGRCLAGAVGAEQGEDLAGLNAQAELVDRCVPTEVFGELDCFEHGLGFA